MPVAIILQDFVDKSDDEHMNGPHATASQRQVRMVEEVHPQRSPDPIRQGDTPARPAKWPTYVAQSRASIHAVMEDEFQFLVWAPEYQIQQLPGVQAAFGERSNVRKPDAVAYGSLFEMTPYDPYVVR